MSVPIPHRISALLTSRSRPRGRRQTRWLAGIGIAACGATAAITAGALPASAATGSVNLVADSTPQPVYTALIGDFNKTKAGQGVNISTSFGPSGTQASNVVAGQPADVVNFSNAADLSKLVAAKLVPTTWAQNSYHGMVTNSVVAFAVPKGNPEHITSWADLLKPGIRIFTPNPYSSGAARWNILAAYGSQIIQGRSATNATAFLSSILKATVVQGASGASELQTFLVDQQANKSDVLIDYESDIIQARQHNASLQLVVPAQTMLIQNPIAVTTDAQNPPAAASFVKFLLSPAGQTQWAKLGYRPALPNEVAAKWKKKFVTPKKLFSIEASEFGGWTQATTTFFSTTKGSLGIVTQIENSLGVAT